MNLAALFMAFLVASSTAVSVKMPSAENLKERFADDEDFAHFDRAIDLAKRLADKQRQATGIATEVTYAFADYVSMPGMRPMAMFLQARIPELLRLILQDDNAAIEELEAKGFMKNWHGEEGSCSAQM